MRIINFKAIWNDKHPYFTFMALIVIKILIKTGIIYWLWSLMRMNKA